MRIKKVDYFRKFRAWGSIYMNQYPHEDPSIFQNNLEKVITWAETLDLPEEDETDVFCGKIWRALPEAPEDIIKAYGYVQIDIDKSYCLSRLLYCGEELRTIPCPEHKGRWGFIRDCICGDSGFLPND